MIRVLLVDDHAVVRAGLAQLLGTVEDIEVVGQAAGGEEAVRLAPAARPDVVLMDLSMPGMGGAEATRRLLAVAPEAHVVALTSFSAREGIVTALDAGATGFLLKDADEPVLIAGIRAAAAGGSPLAPSAASVVLAERGAGRHGELTGREREILALLATGAPNKVIAQRLEISPKTVKAHLSSVFRRIGARDRLEASRWARRQGLAPATARDAGLEDNAGR
jgi:DNA-binding NarL/FixJ family response regulator